MSRNWRLTFEVEGDEIATVDLEDYHQEPRQERMTAMTMHNPPHPGDFIRTEILEPLGLSVAAGAKVLGVSRPTLSTLLNGHSGLSGEMALRLEKAFGVRMDTLMRMQNAFDIAEARKRAGKIKVKRYAAAELTLG